MFTKKNVQEFGRMYDFLKDGELRFKEVGTQRIKIQGAVFSGVDFKTSGWEYFDFVDCEFFGSYSIQLDWIGDCTFTNCLFRSILAFGHAENALFRNCKIEGESFLSFSNKSVGVVFEDCESLNYRDDPNHRGSISSKGEIKFIDCKGRNFAWGGHKKLTLHRCTTRNVKLSTATPALFSDESKMPHSDFLLEDCDFKDKTTLMHVRFNSFTMRRCKVDLFDMMGAVVLKDSLIENIKDGFMSVGVLFKGKLVVRNCSFLGEDGQKNSFEISGDDPTHTLLENITCGRNPADVILRNPDRKWNDPPLNKSFIIRNCNIPYLKVDWAQTEHLRIENCDFDRLDIRNGRIGKLEIINCALRTLNVTNTQVKTQDVRVPEGRKMFGHITITTGSNIKLPRE